MTSNGQYDIIFQEKELFIASAVRTSDPISAASKIK
jgi:hypothetical protein